jgi:hypothetical protein
MFIELPVELQALIGIGITLVVTQVLKLVSEKIGIDLSGYSAKVTAALVGAVVVLVNGYLAKIPVEFAPIVNQVFALIVVVFGSYGAYGVFKGKAKG